MHIVPPEVERTLCEVTSADQALVELVKAIDALLLEKYRDYVRRTVAGSSEGHDPSRYACLMVLSDDLKRIVERREARRTGRAEPVGRPGFEHDPARLIVGVAAPTEQTPSTPTY